jgi:hypothetical protein
MMKRLAIAALAASLFTGQAFAQGGGTTVLGPVTTTVSVVATATMAALPSNPSRRAATVCNGSATLLITFTTGTVTPVSLTTGVVLQTGNVVASCFTIGTPGGPPGGAAVGNQINVICSTAGPCPVTFLEYF